MTSLVGTIPDAADHEPVVYGTITRCAVDGQMWPCADVELFERLSQIDLALIELVDVGWHLSARYPPQLDPPPHLVHGAVIGYHDDDDAGRTFSLLSFRGPRPIIRDLSAREVDWQVAQLPNSAFLRDAYRRLAAVVGKAKGTADPSEVRYLTLALMLAQSIA